MLARRTAASACLIGAIVSVWLADAPARAELSNAQKEQFYTLRKDFFVAMALPPRDGGKLRKEHRHYLKSLTSFIQSLGTNAVEPKAAAHYFRGRTFLRIRRPELARKDFDSCLELLAEAPSVETRSTSGLPATASIRVFRAFTFADEGAQAVLKALEDIPADDEKPRYFEVGGALNDWAEALADDGQVDQAIRAYQLIKRFDLWEEEHQNPDRKIELLRVRQTDAPAP